MDLSLFDKLKQLKLEEFDNNLENKPFYDFKKNQARIVNINIKNVYDYLFLDKEKIEYSEKDIPNVAPPFPFMFFEYHKSSKYYLDKVGVYVQSFENIPIEKHLMHFEETKWISETYVFIDSKKGPGWILLKASLFIDKNGKILQKSQKENTFVEMLKPGSYTEEECIKEATGPFAMYMFPARFATSLMNCKNVNVLAHSPIMHHKKSNKTPTIKYYTLDINPMKKVLKYEGGLEHNGMKKALHICRGHFKTYTEEKPLGGHTIGTYWWHSQVRGSVKHGEIVKDYSVLPKEKNETFI
jgi:hypothetical protein